VFRLLETVTLLVLQSPLLNTARFSMIHRVGFCETTITVSVSVSKFI